mgnify:CR=1 FL=1
MLTSFLPGFALSLTLIMAIGAQNAFVLRQGLRREHVLVVVLVCATSDAILITAGVAGFGALAEAAPWFGSLMRYGGAAFLLWQGGPDPSGPDLAEPACLSRHIGAAWFNLGAVSRPPELWDRRSVGEFRVLLCPRLWRAAACAAFRQAAQLADFGRRHRRDHVGDCDQIACDVNKSAAPILPLAALWERVAA